AARRRAAAILEQRAAGLGLPRDDEAAQRRAELRELRIVPPAPPHFGPCERAGRSALRPPLLVPVLACVTPPRSRWRDPPTLAGPVSPREAPGRSSGSASPGRQPRRHTRVPSGSVWSSRLTS